MKEFVEYLVKNLVDNPDQVVVSCDQETAGLHIRIKVSVLDMGKLVGKKGQIIKALRTIILSICARMGKRVKVEIIE